MDVQHIIQDLQHIQTNLYELYEEHESIHLQIILDDLDQLIQELQAEQPNILECIQDAMHYYENSD